MMTLIGHRYKGRNVFSRMVLITRKLTKTFKIIQDGKYNLFQNRLRFYGGHGDGVTPLPIPNREVKPISADGTAALVGEYDAAIMLQSPSY